MLPVILVIAAHAQDRRSISTRLVDAGPGRSKGIVGDICRKRPSPVK